MVVVLIISGCAAPAPTTPGMIPTLATPGVTSTLAASTPSPALTPVNGGSDQAPAGFVPGAIAFADVEHGWVAGTTGGRRAFVLETADGGATWSASEVGPWVAVAIAAAPDGPWVSSACPDDATGCTPALEQLDPSGTWRPAAGVDPLAIDFAGTTGVLAAVLNGQPRQPSGMPIPAIEVTTDGGTTWTMATNPCGQLNLETLTLPSEAELLVLCGGEGAGGGQVKVLFESADLGGTWSQRASTDDRLPLAGTGIGVDIAADGSGLWWGVRTPVMATTDGGRTWTPLDVADGDARIGGGGSALGGGSGYLLVGDGDRGATLLLGTRDGSSWDERMVWPDPPCCGG